jgi:hypothetical protein
VPRCKFKLQLNPPGEFGDHAEMVASAIRDAEMVTPEPRVDVVYGFGPSAEVAFNVTSLDSDGVRDLVRLAETLRTGDTHAEVVAVELWLDPAERDEAEGEGGRLGAYDEPYRQARGA